MPSAVGNSQASRNLMSARAENLPPASGTLRRQRMRAAPMSTGSDVESRVRSSKPFGQIWTFDPVRVFSARQPFLTNVHPPQYQVVTVRQPEDETPAYSKPSYAQPLIKEETR